MRHWWEDAVFYQIYPRSFADSNGDGIGDLAGISGKLGYLAELGVDALWISPFFKSPMKDFGYDVSDYRDVDPMFGTLNDLKKLLVEAKSRGIRIVLDLVANHSSDEHPWFVEARSSKDAPKHGWYLWVPDTGRPPNNWKAIFELGTAWHANPATGERYLGTFSRHQPEFDWRVSELREAMYDVMRYWYELGVDGFRLDVATGYFKDAELRSNPLSLNANPDFFQRHVYDRNRPECHEVFKEMRAVADAAGAAGGGERVLIGETHGQDPVLAASCYGRSGDELHMAFNFDFLFRKWSAREFRASAERWYALIPEGACPNFTLSNHDRPRHVWRYRGRGLGRRRAAAVTDGRARVAAAMLLTLRGTPFIYYGEEIGMTCERIPRGALRDPMGVVTWPLRSLGRDPERTPMQWSGEKNSGFSSASGDSSRAPWLPANSDYVSRNVAAQEADPSSLLAWYKTLISLRRSRRELREGGIVFIDLAPDVLAYERTGRAGDSLLVLLNFSSRRRRFGLVKGGRVLLGSARAAGAEIAAGPIELGPCEVVVAEIGVKVERQ
jgi:alpha-glucosidase